MSTLNWQKSSFSSGDGNTNCVEVAAAGNRSHLRESDAPAHVLAPSPAALHGLLAHLKAGPAQIR